MDFYDGTHLFIASLLALRLRLCCYSFIPVIGLNYRPYLCERYQILTGSVFLPMFIFLEMIYSKNEETGGISSLPNHGGWAFTNVLKIFKIILWISQFVHGISKFFRNHKSKKSLNFPFRHYQMFSKSTRGNERL